MKAYIVNNEGATVYINGQPKKVSNKHYKYKEILEMLSSDCDGEEILKLISCDGNEFGFSENKKDGVEMHPVLAKKYASLVEAGLSCAGLHKFFENLSQNPSASSVNELYDFLSYKELPITEDGCFIAYKGVGDDDYSITGNTGTKVINGVVDKQGRILNTVGSRIEVARNEVDDNRNMGCSYGLHAGSYDYASGFGRKVLSVKVNPKDVVSVPTDCSYQKVRVCAYEVLEVIGAEKTAVATDSSGKEVMSEFSELHEEVEELIEDGYEFNYIKEHLNISTEVLLVVLNELGIDWEKIILPNGKEYFILY